MSDVNRTRLVIVHAIALENVQDLGQMHDVVGRIHPERFDRYVIFMICPAPDVGVSPGSEGDVVELLDLVGVQIVRVWQGPSHSACLPQCPLKLALRFWNPVIVFYRLEVCSVSSA